MEIILRPADLKAEKAKLADSLNKVTKIINSLENCIEVDEINKYTIPSNLWSVEVEKILNDLGYLAKHEQNEAGDKIIATVSVCGYMNEYKTTKGVSTMYPKTKTAHKLTERWINLGIVNSTLRKLINKLKYSELNYVEFNPYGIGDHGVFPSSANHKLTGELYDYAKKHGYCILYTGDSLNTADGSRFSINEED